LIADGPEIVSDPSLELSVEIPRKPAVRRKAEASQRRKWSFAVLSDEIAATLALKGGGPLLVREITLTRLP
jgi:hypothetical protein